MEEIRDQTLKDMAHWMFDSFGDKDAMALDMHQGVPTVVYDRSDCWGEAAVFNVYGTSTSYDHHQLYLKSIRDGTVRLGLGQRQIHDCGQNERRRPRHILPFAREHWFREQGLVAQTRESQQIKQLILDL